MNERGKILDKSFRCEFSRYESGPYSNEKQKIYNMKKIILCFVLCVWGLSVTAQTDNEESGALCVSKKMEDAKKE